MKNIGPWILASVLVVVIGGPVAVRSILGPPVPVNPAPSPVTPSVSLATLVPEAESRAKLAAFYRDLATVIRSESCPLKTTGDFRDAYRLAVPLMQDAGRLPNVQAIDAPISERLKIAMGGLQDQPLGPVRDVLAGTLDAISTEFGG